MKENYLSAVLALSMILVISSCGKEEKVTRKNALSFEEIVLNDAGYYNGADGLGGFTSGNAKFKTIYTPDGYWSGFAVSNHTDTITPDFTNQYSSVTGSGAGKSEKYLVLFSSFAPSYLEAEDTIEFLIPAIVTNIGITNTSYAYHSMKNGDMFAKKFGGESGNDPDYFNLHISAVNEKGTRSNFNPIPLADYTFSDNSEDYISDEWTYYDLSNAGYVKYLIFSFDSSDKTESYLNTPTYVCIDNLVNEYKE